MILTQNQFVTQNVCKQETLAMISMTNTHDKYVKKENRR